MGAWSGFGGIDLAGPSGRQEIQFDPSLFQQKGWNGWHGSAVHKGPDAGQNYAANLYFEDEAGNRLGGGALGRANSWDLSGIDPSKRIFARWENAGPNGLNLSGNGRTSAMQPATQLAPGPAPAPAPGAGPVMSKAPAPVKMFAGAAPLAMDPMPAAAATSANPFAPPASGTPQIPQQPAAAPPPVASAPAPTTPPMGNNPLARPTGTLNFPGNIGPVAQPGAPTHLPNVTPGQPQSWQDLIASVFGGGQASNENRQVGRTGLDPRLDALYSTFLNEAVSRYNDPNGRTFYNGATVANLTPDEMAAQEMLRGTAGQLGGMGGAGADYFTTMLERAVNPAADPTLQAAIDAMAADTNQQATDPNGVLASIRRGSSAAGTYGSSRQGIAEGVAASRIADSIARRSAEMRLAGRAQNTAAAQGALSNVGNITQAATTPAALLSAVGGQNRQIAQQQMDDQLRRWAYNTFEPDRRLQNVMQLIGAAPLGGYQTGSSFTGEDFLAGGNAGTSNSQNIAAIIAAMMGGWSLFNK